MVRVPGATAVAPGTRTILVSRAAAKRLQKEFASGSKSSGRLMSPAISHTYDCGTMGKSRLLIRRRSIQAFFRPQEKTQHA